MAGFITERHKDNLRGAAGVVCRLFIMLVPTALLLAASVRYPGMTNLMLWMGAAFQGLVCLLCLCSRRTWDQVGPSVVTLYLVALAWLWFGDRLEDWFTHFARAVLLIIPLFVFGYQTLYESGAPALRRANILAARLANRKDWPTDLSGCRALPEVKALRAALVVDASPALALLYHPRPEVRVAALAALEFRKEWRPGQAEAVLQVAQRAEQPAVRAAAVAALGNVEDRLLVETVAQFLHDTSREVRKAAAESLLWDTEQRWTWIRFAVRRILADPLFYSDGALNHEGQLLSNEAVKDLTAWCAEKGVLSARAALTLGSHYNRALTERPDQGLVESLRAQLSDPHAPAVLRLELGKLLQLHQELNLALLERMLDPANPGSLRLIACETILSEFGDSHAKSAAVAGLRDLARLPNREIALATADVVQRRLGVDLGLGLGQPLPAIHSRQAAEITRRVMHWASQHAEEEDEKQLEDSRLLMN
jgi:hypothetical protein